MIDAKQYEFVEVWRKVPDTERPSMVERGLIPDICDFNDGLPVEAVGAPPAHYGCLCDTVVVIREKESVGNG